MKKLLPILRVFLYIIVFFGAVYIPNDFDFGWHIKYGEYFVTNHQVLRDNIMSTDMTSYHWINHEWLSDVISYLAFHSFGFLGTSLLGAFIITFSFFIFSHFAKLSFMQELLFFPALLYIEDAFFYVSYRGQLVSVAFIGLLLFLLEKSKEAKSKSIYTVPFLFLLWANIHGGFLIGLGLFAIWIVFFVISLYWSETKTSFDSLFSMLKIPVSIFLLSIATSMINPFGIGVYFEGLHHFGNQYLKYIIEWTPFDSLSQLWWNHVLFTILLSLGLLTLFFQNKWINYLPHTAITLTLLFFSFFERRYAWPLYIVAIPLIKPLTDGIIPQKSRTIAITSLFFLFLITISIGISKYPFSQFLKMNWDTYCDTGVSCSPKVAEFLSSIPHDKLLTYYGWGGWLIANYPSIKPSIDGRMHLWQESNGYSAFATYYAYEQNWKDISSSTYNMVLISKDKPLYDRLLTHVQDGSWILLYDDTKAAVFKRKYLL